MTLDDDRTEVRVRAAFAGELRRAESDVELSPVGVGSRSHDRQPASGPQPSRKRRSLRAGVLVATVALVAFLAVGASLLSGELRHPAAPQAGSPSAASTQTASPISRYTDGIPSVWQGEPVLRWNDALARGGSAKDDTPFYVGVWLNIDNGPRSCPAEFGNPSAPNSWIRLGGCTDNPISADEGGPAPDLNGVATFQFAVGDFETGPAILRVHVHDPRASDCGPQQDVCDRMIVVEQAVWAGGSQTDARPFSAGDVIAAGAAVEPKTSLSLLPADGPNYDPPLAGAIALSAGGIQPADMQIVAAYIMTSADAIHRALPDVQPGAAGALLPSAYRLAESGSGPGYSYSVTEHWLVVDNVAFAVLLEPEATPADEAWLVSLEAALKAQEGGPSPT